MTSKPGEKALDETLAAIGGLMDQDTRRLNEQVLGLLGFKKELFPALGRSGTVLGNISNAVAKELGIPRLQADMAAGCVPDQRERETCGDHVRLLRIRHQRQVK